jgi:carbamoyl-phosphate synthase small subunit
MKKSGYLVLADGTVFPGTIIGLSDQVAGELVFSTASTGYTEILSDPSFYGQIVVLSNPEIGNYGVSLDDMQSSGIKLRALVVRNLSTRASSFRSDLTLYDWLMREQIPVMVGVDTRALIAKIRDQGAMMALLGTSESATLGELLKAAQAVPPMADCRLSPLVAVREATAVNEHLRHIDGSMVMARESRFRVVALDFGIKKELLRHLHHVGANLILLPPHATAEDIWLHKPDGVFLSNGPGDPKTETRAVNTVRNLLGKVPIFGVCLGHQILAQALGMPTYKLKFGHRGSNQAVKLDNGSIWMTAQNHGFAVGVDPSEFAIKADTNLSDQSNEGIDLPELSVFSVQFHPEGAPGPKDAVNCFEKFINYMDDWKKKLQSSSCLTAKTNPTASRIAAIAEDRHHR